VFPSRIRTVSNPDPGSASKNKYFNPKKMVLSSKKYDPGCSSRIPDPDADFLPIPDPGSRSQKGTGSRIRIRNTGIKFIFFISSLFREVLWTKKPCKNFHLLICAALLDTERSSIIENKYGFTEILKHVNDLAHRIDLQKELSRVLFFCKTRLEQCCSASGSGYIPRLFLLKSESRQDFISPKIGKFAVGKKKDFFV
jgi:hypothetical protein